MISDCVTLGLQLVVDCVSHVSFAICHLLLRLLNQLILERHHTHSSIGLLLLPHFGGKLLYGAVLGRNHIVLRQRSGHYEVGAFAEFWRFQIFERLWTVHFLYI